MMTVIVREAAFSGTICTACSHAMIVEAKGGKMMTYCQVMDERMPPVERCSHFNEKGAKSIYDLEQIAWIIDKGPMKHVGFNAKVKFLRPGDKEHEELVGLEVAPHG